MATKTPAKTEAGAPQTVPVQPVEALAVRKDADGRYYAERVTLLGDKVVARKQVADNFTLEGLMLDATIRLRQLIGDTFNPLVKR